MEKWIFIGILFFLFGCQSDKKAPPETVSTRLITNIEDVRLREAPGENSKVLSSLPKGTVLYDLGEVSDFTTKVQLRGIQFDEPWLKVRTEDGTAGWVYGGSLHFTMNDPSKLATLLMEKRLQTLFGKLLADSIRAYRQDFQAVQSAQGFAAIYRKGTTLRDTMVGLMEARILVGDLDERPDLFWLEQAMPGFVPQLVAEGTIYYLFWDYKQLNISAKATPETTDDNFVNLAMAIFPEDSIEFFYPVWFIQTWDYGGSSLLGRGLHDKMLAKMDEALQKSDLFAPEIMEWKSLLVNDITDFNVTYWEAKEKIVAELDTIVTANYKILTAADKIALQTRRKQFKMPVENKIQVNQQSGN